MSEDEDAEMDSEELEGTRFRFCFRAPKSVAVARVADTSAFDALFSPTRGQLVRLGLSSPNCVRSQRSSLYRETIPRTSARALDPPLRKNGKAVGTLFADKPADGDRESRGPHLHAPESSFRT